MAPPRITLPDWLLSRDAARVIAVLGKRNARFVGGAVRDALINKNVKDIDIATRLLPEEVMRKLTKKQIKVIPTGLQHGTVTAVLEGRTFEITTLRKDMACDGRHAEVAFTDDWQQDAARRDFTINAMYLDAKGHLYDFFNGKEDLETGKLVFIGSAEARIMEDYLRILRLFRFHAYYGKVSIDKQTLAACRTHAAKMSGLSGERIQAEMFKLLKAPNPEYAIRCMESTGVLAQVIPGMKKLNPSAFSRLCAEDAAQVPYIHLIRLLALFPKSSMNTLIDAVHERWKLSNNYREALKTLAELSMQLKPGLSAPEQKKLCRAYLNDSFAAATWLALSRDHTREQSYTKMLKLAESWRAPQFPLTGRDIMALGVPSGRQVGDLLRKAEADWEAGGYTLTRDVMLKNIKKHLTR